MLHWVVGRAPTSRVSHQSTSVICSARSWSDSRHGRPATQRSEGGRTGSKAMAARTDIPSTTRVAGIAHTPVPPSAPGSRRLTL
eukprot:427777-Pyramimonas_sp.AAC.1